MHARSVRFRSVAILRATSNPIKRLIAAPLHAAGIYPTSRAKPACSALQNRVSGLLLIASSRGPGRINFFLMKSYYYCGCSSLESVYSPGDEAGIFFNYYVREVDGVVGGARSYEEGIGEMRFVFFLISLDTLLLFLGGGVLVASFFFLQLDWGLV